MELSIFLGTSFSTQRSGNKCDILKSIKRRDYDFGQICAGQTTTLKRNQDAREHIQKQSANGPLIDYTSHSRSHYPERVVHNHQHSLCHSHA
jgi:hypothetical protein